MEVNGYEIKPMADLRWADLRGADLCGANLRGADLCGADLCGANLCWADLCGANLRGAYYSIACVMQARWHTPSDETCLELMRLDCELLPDGETKFERWVKDGICPFNGKLIRGYYFTEKKELWKPGRPRPMIEIWEMLCRDHDIKWTKE